jgi:hypothetical protein
MYRYKTCLAGRPSNADRSELDMHGDGSSSRYARTETKHARMQLPSLRVHAMQMDVTDSVAARAVLGALQRD